MCVAREADLAEMSDRETQQGWAALLAAGQRGDAAAYHRFLEAILPFVRAVARQRSHSDNLIEDIVQNALLTIHRVRHTYEPGRPVKPWIATIVSRRAIDANRLRGRVERRELSDPVAYETFADPGANWEEAAESADAVALMMAGLTPKQKEAIELVKLKEMTLVEASAASGQSVGSLKINVHRAILRMRRGLRGEGRE